MSDSERLRRVILVHQHSCMFLLPLLHECSDKRQWPVSSQALFLHQCMMKIDGGALVIRITIA